MSNETTVEVEDVASYIKYINALSPTINGDARTYESSFVFRGQGSTKYDLVPSIGRDSYWRKPGSNIISPIIGSLKHEADIIETACRILPNIFKRDLLPIDFLACLQHYGVPTRLLDVTSNALAALYFACGNLSDDGEVFIFRRPGGDKREYPICQAIADSWHLFMNSKLLSRFASLAISRPYFDYQRDLVLVNYPNRLTRQNGSSSAVKTRCSCTERDILTGRLPNQVNTFFSQMTFVVKIRICRLVN